MGLMFCDDLTPPRQKLYWSVCRHQATIDEWEYACLQAMSRETFHKTPLPGVLLGYVREYREQRQQQQCLAEAREREAKRLALEASPAWQAEQAAKHAEATQMAEELAQQREDYRQWVSMQPRSVQAALGHLNPPDPARWRPLGADDLAYTPQGNPAEAKQRARAQLLQLMSEEGSDGAETA